MSTSKGSRKPGECQRDWAHRQQLQAKMTEVGFVPGTQTAYLRAFDRFEKHLDRKTGATAKVRDARRYLSRLRQKGASKTAYGNASAVLKFFFEEVRELKWNPLSPLRERMINDMRLHSFSDRTQDSYVRSVEGLTRYFMRASQLQAFRSQAACRRHGPAPWPASAGASRRRGPLCAGMSRLPDAHAIRRAHQPDGLSALQLQCRHEQGAAYMTRPHRRVRTTKKPHLSARPVITVSAAGAYHPGSSDGHSPAALPVAAYPSSVPGSGLTGMTRAPSWTITSTR